MAEKIAMVFAGQGAQYVGMGRSVYEAGGDAKRAMDAAELIRPGTLEQCFEGPLEQLSLTENTQPCLFLVDYACALHVREAGFAPTMLAGFSLGELAAAAFSGMLSFEDAFRAVMCRAQLMQQAAQSNPGRMAAVLRLSADEVRALAQQFDSVYPVNYNCPGQTVVACAQASFEPFCAKVKEAGGRAMPLNVSGAFHSPFMSGAGDGLKAHLQGVRFQAPEFPVYANQSAKPYQGDAGSMLALQLQSPVLWQRTIENMRAAGAQAFIEVGPGTTLSGLIQKTLPDAAVYHLSESSDLAALQAARGEGKL